MSEQEDIELLAGEYVLGTLDATERNLVNQRRKIEPELDAKIVAWEHHLSPLIEKIEAAAPRGDLLASILKSIEQGEIKPANVSDLKIIQLRKQVTRWRMGAIGAGALAAALATFLVMQQPLPGLEDQKFIAVFQDDDVPPRFVMSVDLNKRVLTIRPVAASLPEGKTFQLWIKAEPLGPDPKSLGLLDLPEQPFQKGLQQYDGKLLQNATFGISVEPIGGSPTGRPSKGALHGTLIRANF